MVLLSVNSIPIDKSHKILDTSFFSFSLSPTAHKVPRVKKSKWNYFEKYLKTEWKKKAIRFENDRTESERKKLKQSEIKTKQAILIFSARMSCFAAAASSVWLDCRRKQLFCGLFAKRRKRNLPFRQKC